jgi:GNAT superfamily N-acetyltransferase
MVTIRPAAISDIPEISRIHVETWKSTYKGIIPDAYLSSLRIETKRGLHRRGLGETNVKINYFVAEDPTGVLGFSISGPVRGDIAGYKAELYALYIDTQQQRRGIGRQLFSTVVSRCLDLGETSLLAWVLRANPATGFYTRMGGTVVGEKMVDLGISLPEVCFGWRTLSQT